jgi:hypothetical protein
LKRFQNINELKKEKKRLFEKQLFLEGKIDQNWHDLKHSLRPMNIINQVVQRSAEKLREPGSLSSIISDTLTMVAYKLTNTLAEKLNEKVNQWTQKKG